MPGLPGPPRPPRPVLAGGNWPPPSPGRSESEGVGSFQTNTTMNSKRGLTLPAAGCLTLTSPLFLVGPQAGPSWMRVSISDDPMPVDYPWNGTVSLPGSATHGGETEDYPVFIDEHIGTAPSTWGNIKTLYR